MMLSLFLVTELNFLSSSLKSEELDLSSFFSNSSDLFLLIDSLIVVEHFNVIIESRVESVQ